VSAAEALVGDPTPPAAARPPLDVATKFFYGMGTMAGSVKGRLGGLLLFFYNQLVGLPAPWVSAAIGIALFVDAFWDPIVGAISDRTHSRWGRRHPFIYGATIPAAICFALLFMPPLGAPKQTIFLWMLALIMGTRLFDSLNEIPASALLPELTQNYDERTNVSSYRYLFSGVIGALLGVVLTFGVFLKQTKTEHFGQFNFAAYAPFAVTTAIIGAIALLASALATHRFIPYLHKPDRVRQPGQLARVMAAALANRNFVSIAASSLIFGIAVGIAGGLGFYFSTYAFQLGSNALLVLGLSLIPAGLIGVFLAPVIGRALDKKRACLTVFFLAIASTTIPLGAWLLGLMPAGAPWVLPVIIIDNMTTTGLATTGFIIVTSMIADVVDESAVQTGQRSEGLLYAAESLVRKVTSSFAAFIPGLVLGFVQFPMHARPGHVDPTIIRNLILIYLPTYTLITLCSTSALMFYRINRGQHEDNVRKLGEAIALAEAAQEELKLADGPITPNPL
jgi:GPH family glycoside/pentoside/hexuronide:cation symporter